MVEKVDTIVFIPQVISGVTHRLRNYVNKFYQWGMEEGKYKQLEDESESFKVAENIAKHGGIDSQLDSTFGTFGI